MKAKSCKLFAHGKPKPAASLASFAPGAHKAATPGDFGLVVGNPEGTLVTVNGVDAAGDLIDISAVATLAVTPDDPTIATASVSGMTYTIALLKAGSVTFTVVATWTDGSTGPFTVGDPCTVAPGGAVGLKVTHGTPTTP